MPLAMASMGCDARSERCISTGLLYVLYLVVILVAFPRSANVRVSPPNADRRLGPALPRGGKSCSGPTLHVRAQGICIHTYIQLQMRHARSDQVAESFHDDMKPAGFFGQLKDGPVYWIHIKTFEWLA